MKNLLSLKKKIGALLAASMLVSMLPMSMTAMAAETNLITNGDFGDTYNLAQDVSYTDGTDTDTLPAGAKLPTDWDITVGTNLVAQNDLYISGSNNQLTFIGGGYFVSQMVTEGIAEGTQYTLSFDWVTKGRGLTTITWYTYDETEGTYTELSSEQYITIKSNGPITDNKPRYYYNTVAPTGANAAKVTFGLNSIGGGQDNSLDRVSLVAGGVEFVTDGDMENVYNNATIWKWGTVGAARISKTTVASGTYALTLAEKNVTNMYQDVKLIPGQYYKLSYKYAQTGRQASADLSPYITVAYQNAPNGEAIDAVVTQPATNDGVYNDGVTYFYAPEVEGVAAMTARLTLGTRNESDWTGSVFYDDVSITLASAEDVSLESKVNLLKNGGFTASYALESDVSYTDGTYTKTYAAGTVIPADWTIEYISGSSLKPGTSVTDAPKVSRQVNGSGDAYLQMYGTSFGMSQNVNGLVAGQPYEISYTCDYTALRSQVTVSFMRYENGTYTDLASWAAANGKSVINGRLYNANKNVDITSAASSFYGAGAKSANFVLPPYANAVKVTIIGSGIGTNQACNVDDMKLTKTDEYITNGAMDIYTGTSVNNWYNAAAATNAPASSDNPATLISGYSSGTFPMHRFLAESGKVYKISFKYAYDSIAEGMNTKPFVQVTPHAYPDSDIFNVFAGCETKTHTDGQWTEYTGYFYVPEMSNYADGIVNLGVGLRPNAAPDGVTWAGNFYYDDLSVKLADETAIGFTGKETARYGMQEFVTSDASNASLLFVQDTDNVERTFYAARYDKATKALIDVQMVSVGADLKAGEGVLKNFAFGSFDGETTDVYYKVYLWDGEMLPVMADVEYNQ
ncbi:MAG: hypothetical protein IJ366_02065 [Clostridia bacterium]|nr:hypothetical protein [Clostridia bacterium]